MIRTYRELISIPTFKERFEYLKLHGEIGEMTFGHDRYLNQALYKSREWRRLRDQIILRDNGCDLAFPDKTIFGKVIIHHMNPISVDHLIHKDEDALMNPEYLICVTIDTHNAIHYSGEIKNTDPIIRTPNDTCPWKI